MPNYTTPIENSQFNKWTPLIGVYIAGATFVCVIAIVVDLVGALRSRQYWVPSSWSSLNAASITVITAASKLLLDVSTSMPRQIDQLSKLSTSAFVCIALATIAPSIGKLEDGEFPANLAAFSIFVISSVVGLCIQLTNGVIFTFRTAHITMVVMMSILLVNYSASAGFISMFKSYYKVRYDTRHQEALKDVKVGKHPTTEKLKQYLERFSMMAHSACPHFLVAWSAYGIIHTMCGLVAAMAFFAILFACVTHEDEFLGPNARSGTSNYAWSVLYILISQTIGVGVGTVVLCTRGCYIIAAQLGKAQSRSSRKRNTNAPGKYWMHGIERTYWFPLLPYIEYRQQKCLGYLLKFPFYMACLYLKIFLSYIDVRFIRGFPYLIWAYILSVKPVSRLLRKEDDPRLEELRPYFLIRGKMYVQTERMMKSISFVSRRCLGSAGERETKHIRELLQEYHSDGFEGVLNFRIPPISPNSHEPPIPHSWSLSVLTLTWIATALPDINCNSVDKLRKTVTEGLVYVKLLEDSYSNKHDFTNFRTSASLLWLKLDVTVLTDMKRFGFGLEWVPKDRLGDKIAKKTLESIKEFARSLFTQSRVLPYQLVGAHYLYGTCEMILRDCEDDPDDSSQIFDKLRHTISDIMGACLINLKSYILLECERCSSIEKRREAASKILKLFGETEEIMKILENRQIPDIPPEEMVHMDSWSISSP